MNDAMTADELRTACLMFDQELSAGELAIDELDAPAVRRAVRARRVGTRPERVAMQLRYRRGRLRYDRDVVGPAVAARRELLGDRAASSPRFLVRVDEFPHYRAWDPRCETGTSAFGDFHRVMRDGDVPYLLAVLPRVSRAPLSPDGTESRPLAAEEVALLSELPGEGVSFAVHGLDHRTRDASPRRHSELRWLSAADTGRLLDAAVRELGAHAIDADVFVAPYNRFDAAQLPLLAERFDVVCGGPESIGLMGFQTTPQWRGETVYLPAYAPFYGAAAAMREAAQAAIAGRIGLWVPVVLHWEWERRDGFEALAELLATIAPCACPWADFLAAVRRSRHVSEGSRA